MNIFVRFANMAAFSLNLLIVLSVGAGGQAQPPEPQAALPPSIIEFRSLTMKDGLSNPYIYSIVQDHTGFMWFGTASGLNRYGGYTCKTYWPDSSPDNPKTVGS